MLLFYATVDFYTCIFYDGTADIQIGAFLSRRQCRVSDTQVTIKALGPLVINIQRIVIPTSILITYKETIFMIQISYIIISVTGNQKSSDAKMIHLVEPKSFLDRRKSVYLTILRPPYVKNDPL